jgi:transposase
MSKKSGPYRTIDDELAGKIKELHERHPNLGAKGLLNVLKQKGNKVDAKELERFISEQGLKPKSKKQSWRPFGVQAPWDK